MPGWIGNYSPQQAISSQLQQTLGCKMVTSFQGNAARQPAVPTIAATIVLFDGQTGQLSALLQATQITTWRTVAASLVATEHLWFERHRRQPVSSSPITLAIIGCGVEGRAHAIGMATTFPFAVVRLWNRTAARATSLRTELLAMRHQFRESASLAVHTAATVADCVRDADVIVTATYGDRDPLVRVAMLATGGSGVHINAIAAGPHGHFAELAPDLYERAHIYCDSRESAAVELRDMPYPIVGQVGDVMADRLPRPALGALTVFQSLGEWS